MPSRAARRIWASNSSTDSKCNPQSGHASSWTWAWMYLEQRFEVGLHRNGPLVCGVLTSRATFAAAASLLAAVVVPQQHASRGLRKASYPSPQQQPHLGRIEEGP